MDSAAGQWCGQKCPLGAGDGGREALIAGVGATSLQCRTAFHVGQGLVDR